MLRIIKPGLQSTLQGAPRIGTRHLGFPYSGPADAISMSLANRLVQNDLAATCLEITYGGFEATVETACSVSVTGAFDRIAISGRPASAHETLQLKQDDQIEISTPRRGARTYLAIHTGFQADYQFGSSSTYLPAGFGGHKGRSIAAGDVLHSCGPAEVAKTLETPHGLRPIFTGGFALRACQSAETKCLSSAARESLFSKVFSAGRQATRMGIALNGHKLEVENNGKMKSAPVFPGTIQCPRFTLRCSGYRWLSAYRECRAM